VKKSRIEEIVTVDKLPMTILDKKEGGKNPMNNGKCKVRTMIGSQEAKITTNKNHPGGAVKVRGGGERGHSEFRGRKRSYLRDLGERITRSRRNQKGWRDSAVLMLS